MKGILAIIVLFGYLCCVTALPATTKKIDDGIEFVPQKDVSHGDQPIIDTGVGFDGPFSNPFSGLFENIEGLMARVRQQMESLMNRFPGIRSGNGSAEIPDFPSFDGLDGLAPFPQFDIDLAKGNTTSETKIIDGRKVVINETEYRKDTENGSAFFKVRVIDVKPQNSNTEKDSEEVTTRTVVHPPKDRESIENSIENEIIKNKEAIFYQPLEYGHDHVDSPSQFRQPSFAYVTDNSEWNDLNRVEPIEDNSINFERSPPVFDLSRDTYVNELLANSGAAMNPDAEIIEVVPQGSTRTPFLNRFQYPR